MAIKFFNDSCSFTLRNKRKINSWIKEAAASEGYKTGDISIIFCSTERHLEINRQYLSHDYNTDVITFDYTEAGVIAGDIFIDPWTVEDNAGLYCRPAKEELLRVVIHGVLHLMGYHDKTPEQQSLMRSTEDKYLELLDESIKTDSRTAGL